MDRTLFLYREIRFKQISEVIPILRETGEFYENEVTYDSGRLLAQHRRLC